jgi:hypothetical protein
VKEIGNNGWIKIQPGNEPPDQTLEPGDLINVTCDDGNIVRVIVVDVVTTTDGAVVRFIAEP